MEENKFENEIVELEEEVSVPEKPKKSVKAEVLDWAKTLLLYCVLPLALFQSFFFMASVPTGSMENTIPVGAQVVTARIFNKDNVDRGDIIVFESEELDVILIKRCLGLPGDKIVFDGSGRVFINDEVYRESYVSSRSDFEGEFIVPEDCYFFVGDNRAGSFDARYWETTYIHRDFVKGKGVFVLFPFSSFGILK